MSTLAELLAPLTDDELLAILLSRYQGYGLPTTAWTPTTPERATLEVFALGQADQSVRSQTLASGVLLELATRAWLTLLARDRYEVERYEASRTVRRVRLTNSGSAPQTIDVDQFRVRGSATNNIYVASGVGLGVVAAGGGTLDIEVTSEYPNDSTAGLNYTDAEGTLTDVVTPRPGLTATDYAPDFSDVTQTGTGSGTVTPSGTVLAYSWAVLITLAGALGVAKYKVSKDGGSTYGSELTTPGGGTAGPDADGLVLDFASTFELDDLYSFASPGTSIITQGTDEESDENVRIRCRAVLPSTSLTPTTGVYEALALLASSQVTRVKAVLSTTINNTINIYLAGQSGPVGAALINEVQAFIDARVPVADRAIVASATGVAITLAATLRITTGYREAAAAATQTALSTYLVSTTPSDRTIRLAQITEILMAPDGMIDVTGLTINGVAANLVLADLEVATWAQDVDADLTWVEV